MQRTDFIGGVIEGFYGQPWTRSQRLELFQRMSRWGLNTYFYAPKDDMKHRAIWRESYSEAELASIRELIQACRNAKLQFIYGLSPGLDIQFSNDAEIDCIKRRFAQLTKVGCEHFALLFDDLPGNMTAEDRAAFSSIAEAQASVANDVFRWTRATSPACRFLFCPTPYCDRMDRSRLGGEGYLETIGELLEPSIDVLWTGPEIVSQQIPVDSIESLTARIRRKPVIWDNLHANDYDGRRLFCGPYSGRDLALQQHVAGILTNANNEAAINFVAIRTLAAYLAAERDWNPRATFESAIVAWLPSYESIGEAITLDDLLLLADCYYLPHEQGPGADRLFDITERLVTTPVESWGDAEAEFDRINQQVQTLFDKLTELRDRELFYAWSRRAWDLKEELQLLEGFIKQKKAGNETPQIESYLPGTCRGGTVARLQTLLSIDDQGQFHARSEERLDGV